MSSSTTTSSSLQGLYLTLAPVAIQAGIYLLIFLVLRRSHRRWYAPRTYLGSLKQSERSPSLPNGLLNWVKGFWDIPDTYVLQHQSMDAYLFLRYLRVLVIITFVGCVITWPVLFPVNATGGAGQKQLDILSYSNVDSSTFKKRCRYFAHLFMAWIYFIFLMYMIFRECVFYVNLRQAFLLSPVYSQRLSSRTVLLVSVPEVLRDEHRLRKIYGESVRNVWIIRDTDELEEHVEERDKAAFTLEKAEVKLIKTANKERLKALKKGSASADKPNEDAPIDGDSGSIAARWLPRKKRPTHRTGLLGLIGKKVDSIDWCREEIRRLTPQIKQEQDEYRMGKPKTIPAVFIEFDTQAAAENAYQSIAYHEGLQMRRYIGIAPPDVVWSTLSIPWWQLLLRKYAVIAFICVLIIFWAIPVAVVGAISNINYLETISFLTWLKKIPDIVMGLVTGLLPSVLLSLLMSLVPVVMRLCAKLAGEPSNSRVELFTQNAYFCFQVIQVFLVSTLSSSATAVGKQIADDPSSVTDILSNNLPKASNYYMSYFIVQGFSVASGVLAQITGLIIFKLLYKYLTGTPRAMYTKWTSLSAISWGSTLPVYTNIAVIAITYSGIAPLVLGWACVGLACFYLAYRYNVMFVTETQIDTRGLIYPRAIKQLMTGVYLSELCMIGLFGASVAIIQCVMMVVFLVFTVLFHMSLNTALDPLMYNMPQSLLAEEALRHDLEGGGQAARGYAGAEGGITKNSTAESSGSRSVPEKYEEVPLTGSTSPAPHGNFLQRFLKPWVYCNYEAMRQLVPPHEGPADFNDIYTPDVIQHAYLPPCVGSQAPTLWIPEDQAGISKQEIAHSSEVIDITDEGCVLDEKNDLIWDEEGSRPPVWEEKIPY
ncbi:duf221 domain protein [Grosmannia clavigera kw1407]|uniref:Duf221 domain protein n=1 Tax=Grosmannia clavigera (strain kw1407 / UAMH 11150) TaxID=655863 RepID=F0X8J7_GROCL|nr:duf221 domain protein [Grosmannia clavigera kw1407]EFX05642.1 duf221 domain protein [Grosmannia clavigera kw1407]